MNKFRIGDTVISLKIYKIINAAAHDKHPYQLNDGNWYAEDEIQKYISDKEFINSFYDFDQCVNKFNYRKKLEDKK